MGLFRGLSGRLLVLTVVVVMLVEVAIFVPSVARFRADYLSERVVRAEIAAMSVLAAPDGMVSPELQAQLLDKTEAFNIVLRQADARTLILSRGDVAEVAATFDLRMAGVVDLIADALARMAGSDGEIVRVIGPVTALEAEAIEITLDSGPLREAMLDYGWRIFRLSLLISLVTAAIIFLAVRRFVVSPLMRVIGNVKAFQENPEDPERIIEPTSRLGEVAEAEQALAAMQRDVLGALRERARLASLGEALAKVSHDLRNMLSTGHLMADRLETSRDPLVARTVPKLIASLDRAISLCQRTLDYGRAEEAPPVLRQVRLRALAEEAVEGLGLGSDDATVRCRVEIPEARTVLADPEHLYRILANLMRNATEAIAAAGGPGEIVVTLDEDGADHVIRVRDSGPGLPAKAMENLFKPFRGAARRGGAGLGLAIANELARAHGGRLELISSTTAGTEFAIRLPMAPGGAS
ncbi:MAG TPA: HAMP domain-containing sensor histidine kinase [Thermohalobaculum sp.]|nr:HAMP domain-containing sensor histidine kinase [Thermohalobaculum sp.]